MADSTSTIQKTQTPSQNDLESFISLLCISYQSVPLTTALISEIDSISPGTPQSPLTRDRLRQHFSLGIPAAFRSNIILAKIPSTSGSFLAAALLEPPDFSGTQPVRARKNPGPILLEYREVARDFKAKHLAMPNSGPHMYDTPAAPSQASSNPTEDPYPVEFNKDARTEIRSFYHLSFLAKDPTSNAQEADRAAKQIMQNFMEIAKGEDVPILLEASSPESRSQLEQLGFNVLEEVVIGKGRVDERGWPTDAGSGLKVWAMAYNM